MITRQDFINRLGQAADAKLRVENVDPADLVAVWRCLRECVGNTRRLFNAWAEWQRGEIKNDH